MPNQLNSRFEDRVAFVTGGASGIGLKIGERFIDEGGKISLIDLDVKGAEELLDQYPDRVLATIVDVTDEASVLAAVTATVKQFGHLDVVVNAAGITGGVIPSQEADLDIFKRVMAVNVDGTFLTLKHGARAMLASGGGVVVNIASINAIQPGKGMGAYCASKAAIGMLTQVAALDLAPHKIRVVAVGPGLIATPMTARSITSVPELLQSCIDNTPAGRVGETDDVASAVLFLASDEASFITGTTTYVDGGTLLRPFPERPATTPPPNAF